MVVCVCNAIREREVREAARSGATSSAPRSALPVKASMIATTARPRSLSGTVGSGG